MYLLHYIGQRLTVIAGRMLIIGSAYAEDKMIDIIACGMLFFVIGLLVLEMVYPN